MFRFRKILLAALLVLLPVSAALADGSWYLSGAAGATFLQDSTISIPGQPSEEADFDLGYNVRGAVGYNFEMYRLEVELGWWSNDFDRIKGVSTDVTGEMTALTVLFNAFFDFTNQSPWTPYIGLGIGLGSVSVEGLDVPGAGSLDDDDSVMAYQLSAGIGFDLSETSVLDLGYRFMATSDVGIEDTDFEYGSHSFSLGIRFLL